MIVRLPVIEGDSGSGTGLDGLSDDRLVPPEDVSGVEALEAGVKRRVPVSPEFAAEFRVQGSDAPNELSEVSRDDEEDVRDVGDDGPVQGSRFEFVFPLTLPGLTLESAVLQVEYNA